MARWCRDVLLLAAAYLIAGRIGQYLAAPPIYAAAVWPASGVALAGILLLGYRVWPGLLLGAVAVNSWSAIVGRETPADIDRALLTALGIGVGATLQALLGAWLVRRLVGFPNRLNRERDILAFLGLGGLLACMLGATIGVGSLLAAGAFGWPQAASNWWTWWVGDVIGVIIVTPLALIFFATPRLDWRSRRLTVAIPLCLTIIAVAVVFTFTHITAQKQTRFAFERRASDVFDTLEKSIERYRQVLYSALSLYASSIEVTRDEFEIFQRHLLGRNTGIQALAWVPRVAGDQRELYEQQARDDGFPEFMFTQRANKTSTVPVTDRLEYFPVYFIVPLEGNRPAFGFDLASNTARRRALFEARDTGEQIATAPIRLVQEKEQQASFLVIVPVYANDRPTNTREERRQHLQGFLTGAFRVGDIVNTTLPSFDSADFALTIRDKHAETDNQLLFDSGPTASRTKAAETLSVLATQMHWTAELPVGGRTWVFDFVPNERFFATQADNDTWIVLAGGLLFTSLLGVFLMIVSGRATQVEGLVVERTEELTNANRELEREIAARMRFEAELSRTQENLERRVEERTADLKASEARYQDLYHHAPDMFVSVNVATQRLTECNTTFLEVTGFEENELVGRQVFDLYHDDSQVTARDSFREFLRTGHVKDVELNLLRKNKPPLAVSLNVSAVRDERGQLILSRAVLRDISEKKLAEEKIKHHEAELAHVARLSTMGEMAAGLAHEINQPLAAIAAYAEGISIRMRSGNMKEDQFADIIRHIASDAHRAGEVIRRLRQFVRNREPDRGPVDINSLVEDVTQFVASDAAQRQVRMQTQLAADLPNALTDTIEFQQVLLNLVRNGFDAMSENSASDRVLIVRTKSADAMVEISVEDRGHGLPGNTSDQVFEAFYTSKEEGLGMGLAISRSIVEAHGGRIWATPTATGAIFHFTLPVASSRGTPESA